VGEFGTYKTDGHQWITVMESEFYPDKVDAATVLYGPALERFGRLLEEASDSAELLRLISDEPDPLRVQLLRIYRRYVSPDTSVEMLKRKGRIGEIVSAFGDKFRDLNEVRRLWGSRPQPDETLMSLLYEHSDRGQKGYDLTEAFFTWFQDHFGDEYELRGPRGAGRDVMLHEVLEDFSARVPADFLISRTDGTPLVVGFARYDSDRGGAQEDDRTSGNHEKVTIIREYATQKNIPLKVLFINDGPGLLLGSMWDDYDAIEDYGAGAAMVCTLKMLDERVTQGWLES
jgi:hypothetical protein